MSSSIEGESVLLTGGTGFIGSHLARHLVQLGREVHLIVRPGSKLRQLSAFQHRVHFHVHDGGIDSMIAIMRQIKPSCVFHLASLFIAEHRPENVDELLTSNVVFGTQLLEAMNLAGGSPKLVNTGTSWQHYESQERRPVCLYAAAKQAFEDVLEFYIDTGPMKAITLKLFDTYGPWDPRRKLFRMLGEAANSGATLEMSAGEQLLDLVYIDDVIRAYLNSERLLMDGAVAGHEAYGVGSGRPRRLRDVVATYEAVYNAKLNIIWGARPYRKMEVMTPWTSFRRLPGWSPQVDLEEGLRITEAIEKGDCLPASLR